MQCHQDKTRGEVSSLAVFLKKLIRATSSTIVYNATRKYISISSYWSDMASIIAIKYGYYEALKRQQHPILRNYY
jgi:hypothetical protein